MAEKIGTKIDDAFNKTEKFLTNAAAVPVLGTVAGLIKALMGLGQSIVGVAGGILTLPARCTGNSGLNDRFWTHVKHGAGNIAAGTFEAIPLVGTGMYYVRDLKKGGTNSDYRACVQTNHDDKFMPYKSLCERDFVIVGADEEMAEKANKLFTESLNTALTENPNLSDKEKYKMAKEAVKNA